MPLRSERLKQLLAHRLGNRLVFFLLAIVIGALVGLATVALIWLIELVHRIGYGTADEDGLAAMIASLPAWQVILVPTLGGAVVGGLLRFMPGQRYHGIADVMEACALNSARMPVRSDLVAALAAGVSLGSGVPLGREGPAVHIGSSLSALVAEKLGLDHRHSLALLGCGAASAVAVSFSTPITAVIFALEVIVGYYTLWVFAPVVIAAMAGMMVREAFLGQGTLFDLPARELASMWELLSFALLGVVAALFARAQLGVIPLMTGFWERLALPRLMRPAAAGVLIGVAALAFPHVLGLGIEGTQTALEGGFGAGEYTGLFIVKWLVVCLALASGFAGGVFGPAVFLGAMLGGAFWSFLSLTGLPLSEVGVYATIGMGAMASAMLGAPISTILIVFELTHDYGITLGVMTATAIASTVMQLGDYGSFFRWQLMRRNVNLASGRDSSVLMTHRVEDLVKTNYAVVPPDITAGECSSRLGSERKLVAMFVDEAGVFQGSVSLAQLLSYSIEQGMDARALDAAMPADYAITPNTNIVMAVQSMAEVTVEFLPVVTRPRATEPLLAGVVWKSDLLAEHYDAVKRAREEEFGIT